MELLAKHCGFKLKHGHHEWDEAMLEPVSIERRWCPGVRP